MANEFEWVEDTLTPGLREFPAKVDRAAFAAIQFGATQAEAHARATAPWNDQTGNARATLRASTEHEPLQMHRIILSHGMPYGIWLEVRGQGKNRVIIPTINWTGDLVMRTLAGLLKDI